MPTFMATADAALRSGLAELLRALPRGQQLPPDQWQRRHRFIVALLVMHGIGIFIFAVVRGEPIVHSALEASLLIAIAGVASIQDLPATSRSVAATFGLLTASALLVHFSGGVIEMHFHFFVMVAVISLYQHWTPFLVAIGYVVVQHGTVGVLFPEGVYNHAAAQAGPWKWAAIHGLFIAGESIACLAYWKMAEQTTEAKQAVERSLAATRERFRHAFESSAIGMLLTETDGTIVEVNKAFYEMLGYPEDELRRLTWEEMIHPDDFARMSEVGGDIVAGKRESGSELIRFIHKDGHDVWAQMDFGLVESEEEGALYFMSQANDVTRRIEAEQQREVLESQLRQAQKMEAVGHLTGGIAHDFNNLLGVISNFASFAAEEIDETTTAAADLKEVQAAATRAQELTRQLLTFSRKEVVKPLVLDLGEIVSDFQKILRRALTEDIEMETHIATDAWPTKIDPRHVEQVLMNLAVNARDAMPNGGRISIVVKNVSLDADYVALHPGLTVGDYVCLSVSDDGVGMTHEVQEQIFEPFFTTKDRGSGTGLGMSTVYGIVKQAGGYITVYSELGLGTSVKVYLPRTSDAVEDVQPEVRPATHRGSERILVVEDEPRLLMVAQRILERAGYSVMTASSGPEALEALADADPRPDLIVTDVVMPKMSGREVAERSGLPAVFMSGYDDSMVGGAEVSDAPFVQKPFTSEELLSAVRHALDTRKASAPSGEIEVTRPRRVLVIDDEPSMLEVVDLLIGHTHEGVQVSRAQDAPQALRLAREVHPSIIVLDYMIPDTDAQELAGMLREIVPEASILVFSAALSEQPLWADAFLTKSRINELAPLVGAMIRS